jgi:hypothetical protein
MKQGRTDPHSFFCLPGTIVLPKMLSPSHRLNLCLWSFQRMCLPSEIHPSNYNNFTSYFSKERCFFYFFPFPRLSPLPFPRLSPLPLGLPLADVPRSCLGSTFPGLVIDMTISSSVQSPLAGGGLLGSLPLFPRSRPCLCLGGSLSSTFFLLSERDLLSPPAPPTRAPRMPPTPVPSSFFISYFLISFPSSLTPSPRSVLTYLTMSGSFRIYSF